MKSVRWILPYSSSHLAKNKAAAFLTLFGVALGTAIVLAILRADQSSVRSFRNAVDHIKSPSDLSLLSPSGSYLSDRWMDRLIRRFPDLPFRMTPLLEETVLFKNRTFLVKGVDFLSASDRPVKKGLKNLLLTSGGIYLPPGGLKRNHLRPGDRINVLYGTRSLEFQVLGEIPGDVRGQLIPRNTFFMDLSWAQMLFRHPGQITRLDLSFRTSTSKGVVYDRRDAKVEGEIRTLAKGRLLVLSRHDRLSQYDTMLASYRSNLIALSLVAFLVGFFLIANTMHLLVVRRRAEFSTLRLLGTSREEIRAILFSEALIFGLVGGLAGILLGHFLARYTVAAVRHTITTLYLPPHILPHWTTLREDLLALLFSMGVSALATIGPVREASSVPPVLGLSRMEEERPWKTVMKRSFLWSLLLGLAALLSLMIPPVHRFSLGGYLGAFFTVFAASSFVPFAVTLASPLLTFLIRKISFDSPIPELGAATFTRAISRTRVAVSAVMVGLGMVVGITLLVLSFEKTLTLWIDDNLRADIYIKPVTCLTSYCQETLPAFLYPLLKQRPEIESVARYSLFPVQFQERRTFIAYSDLDRFYRNARLSLISSIRGENERKVISRFSKGEGVLLSEPFANRFHLGSGDSFSYLTPRGVLRKTVLGVYRDYSTAEGIILVRYADLSSEFGKIPPSNLSIFLKDARDTSRTMTYLANGLPGHPRLLLRSQTGLRNRILEVFHQSFAITYALLAIAGIVSIFGVANTLTLLLYERRREFMLYRTLGLSFSEQVKILVTEAGLIAFFGCLAGVALGLAVGGIIVFVINKESFGWTILWTWPIGTITGLATFLFLSSLLSVIVPAWVLKRFSRGTTSLRGGMT